MRYRDKAAIIKPMQYRSFPKIYDVSVSALGLGCMRLPVIDGDPARIDKPKADAVFEAALEAGVNYFDTAWAYHKGSSEAWLGEAVEQFSARDKLYIASKSPVWLVQKESDWEKFLDQQLKKLKTGHIDFYLMHALNRDRWNTILQKGGLEFLAKAKRDGRIRHAGFSFHDSYNVFKDIVDGWDDWEFCQIQYNYLDEEYQAGAAGLRYAEEKALGVIVMEPLRGGALASIPKAVLDIFATYGKPRMAVEWALRHVLDRQEVVMALSGMGKTQELWENVAIASSARINSISRAERAILDKAKAWFDARMAVPCTGCGYCKPCPFGVNIPEVFGLWNRALMFDNREKACKSYKSEFAAEGGPVNCTQCEHCIPLCPQGINIPTKLKEARQFFEL